MKACNAKLRRYETGRPTAIQPAWRPVERPRLLFRSWGFAAAWVAGVAILIHILPAHAQPTWQPKAPQYVQCPAPGQPLLRIPELVSLDGKLRATMLLNNNVQRMFLGANDSSQCLPQDVRQFRGVSATLPAYTGSIPPGFPGYTPPPSYPGFAPVPASQYFDPVPGPTLRARVGDLIELTFLNQIGGGPYWNTIDRGEKGQGCDESTAPYPGLDTFPDCFHGSTTGNIHFHGTHTNPGTTGDNVFIEVRPSLRDSDGQPVVTEASVQAPFDSFFARCETELNKSVLSQWPPNWNALPAAWVAMQESLLKRYDQDPVIINKLWPIDEAQRAAGAWPQYYIGATPYCFRLPAYVTPGPTQVARPPGHMSAMTSTGAMEETRALEMGQAPGTHWYHAHKHGSTTIDVANGMTGAFIIEGGYDDALNSFYNADWTGPQPWARAQPVLVINQLGTSPNLFGGGATRGGPLSFSVNGRFQPEITMQPGQVQLWRIANTSSRGGVFLAGFAPANATAPSSPQTFEWKQIAQDGVQFKGPNFSASQNPTLLLSAGNRADLLVQAPSARGQYVLLALQARSRCETLLASQVPTIPTTDPPQGKPAGTPTPICGPGSPVPLLSVNVTGTPATGHQALFIPPTDVDLSFPPFLKDITDNEIKSTKTVLFESTPTSGGPPAVMHAIDGHKFDGNVGEVMLLNTAEEWKIENRTVNGGVQNGKVVTTDPPGVVDHPFHIHINPFQIVEFFDPNEVLPGTSTYKYIFEGTADPGQCLLDITKPDTWKPCDHQARTNLIWWDVFAIPSARAVFQTTSSGVQSTVVPGYFKMRSRFVDFTGQYVVHCHILSHEDRGMMTVVEVVPFTTAYSHQ